MRVFGLGLGLAVGLWACAGEGKDARGDDDDDHVSDTDTGTGTTDTTTPPGAVTFADDVRPLVASGCAHCHGPSGLGPMDFLDYEVASSWAEIMLARIDAGEMPPPAADPECNPYQGSAAMHADPELRAALAAWIDGGKLPGDLAAAPEVEVWSPPTLSRRDVELRAAAPFVPQYVDGNEYRCFLVDEGVEADTWISGIEFLLDNPAISHHAVLFVDPSGGSEARVTDPASKSWTCPEVQPEPDWIMLHAWAPSGGAVEMPEGMGLRLAAGDQVVLQMHYWQGTDAELADQPAYALKLEEQVEREMIYLPVGPDSFVIPAGAANHTETVSLPMFLLGGAWDFYGVMPHMHVLGTAYDFSATGGGGDKCLSRSDGYDFALQPTYWFEEPVRLGLADTLHVSCTWDNSANNPRQLLDPPQDVTWGENTQQEMCYALMYASPVP